MSDGEDSIKRFLTTLSYLERKPGGASRPVPDIRNGHRPFVTISRQTGAGGRRLAEALLKVMAREKSPIFHGWQVCDKELCQRLVEDPALKVSMRALLTETYRSEIEDTIFLLLGGQTPQEIVLKRMFEAIRTLATFGEVIIIGRGGVCLTRDLPLGVHVRLVGSEPVRVQRMMELFGYDDKEARSAVKRQDLDRARLLREWFRRDIDDSLLYDATWNTDAVPFDVIASSIVALIKERLQRAWSERRETVEAT